MALSGNRSDACWIGQVHHACDKPLARACPAHNSRVCFQATVTALGSIQCFSRDKTVTLPAQLDRTSMFSAGEFLRRVLVQLSEICKIAVGLSHPELGSQTQQRQQQTDVVTSGEGKQSRHSQHLGSASSSSCGDGVQSQTCCSSLLEPTSGGLHLSGYDFTSPLCYTTPHTHLVSVHTVKCCTCDMSHL